MEDTKMSEVWSMWWRGINGGDIFKNHYQQYRCMDSSGSWAPWAWLRVLEMVDMQSWELDLSEPLYSPPQDGHGMLVTLVHGFSARIKWEVPRREPGPQEILSEQSPKGWRSRHSRQCRGGGGWITSKKMSLVAWSPKRMETVTRENKRHSRCWGCQVWIHRHRHQA